MPSSPNLVAPFSHIFPGGQIFFRPGQPIGAEGALSFPCNDLIVTVPILRAFSHGFIGPPGGPQRRDPAAQGKGWLGGARRRR
ncbi:MAG: hypothetical protein CM15mP125_2300 [Gammaproteobacteria bacterium]|nr:MAG: hypothetical protein CM15mP125_2300 [Gammaproteobacteria bacterium]